MGNYPLTCNDADSFIAFMNEVWEPKSWDLYDQYHDATYTIRQTSARRTGSGAPDGNDPRWCQVWRFPNGTGVVISPDGNGVRKTSRRQHHKHRE